MGFASVYTVISLCFRNYFFAFLSLVIHCFFIVVQLLIGITKYPERDALKVLLKVIEPLGKEDPDVLDLSRDYRCTRF